MAPFPAIRWPASVRTPADYVFAGGPLMSDLITRPYRSRRTPSSLAQSIRLYIMPAGVVEPRHGRRGTVGARHRWLDPNNGIGRIIGPSALRLTRTSAPVNIMVSIECPHR
ncbi:unnamed protein product, partial [Iphiclides podalirius]